MAAIPLVTMVVKELVKEPVQHVVVVVAINVQLIALEIVLDKHQAFVIYV